MKSRQSGLWLLASLAAPAAHFAGGGWLSSLVAAAAVLPLALIGKEWSFSRPLAVIQILWLGIVAGVLLPGAAVCWPSDNALAVPLTLLTLAAITGVRRAPRIGAILAFAMGLLALPMAAAGAARLELRWLPPSAVTLQPMLGVVLLTASLPAGGEGKGRWLPGAGVLTVILGALIQGVLSPGVAAGLGDPEYQTARALGYLEPVAASALTLGWYAMASRLFASAAEIAQKSQMGEWLSSVLVWWTALAAVLMKWQLSAPFLMVLSTFLWCFTPFFQKMKKVKNSA